MKSLNYKGLILSAATIVVMGLSADSVFAQRPNRGSVGAGGTSAPSRGSVGGGRGATMQAPSRGAQVGPSRAPSVSRQPMVQSPGVNRGIRNVRPNVGYRPGYRSGYNYRPGYNYRGGYNRAYYGFYNYYRPFIGFRLNVLPFGYYPFYFGSNQFYFSDGLFYRQYENNYQVVVPPVGAEVPNLPSSAELVTIDGQDYYEYKGVYYTLSTNADGKQVYIVAGKDGVLNTTDGPVVTNQIGDVIDALPDGSKEVTIKNETYFVSPDDVYFEQVIDGDKTRYRVIGRLY
jgi:hypothetical protein